MRQWKASWVAIVVVAILPYWAVPAGARIENYPRAHTPELNQLVQWAKAHTGKDDLFLFPDAGHELYPGIFRAEAVRALYVDWKSGGQVNHFQELGAEWWARWQRTMASEDGWKDIGRFAKLDIDYVVLKRGHRSADRQPVFENSQYLVYRP
jgi:hypothetical protein